MKNLFGLNKDKEEIDGIFYLDRELSKELVEEVEKSRNELDSVQKKASLPFYYKLIYYISFFYLLIVLLFISSGLESDVAFIDIIKSNLILIIIGGVDIIVLILMHFYIKNKTNKIVESNETKQVVSKAEDLYNRCLEDLKIPTEHYNVDVFTSFYEEKDGQVKTKKAMGLSYIALQTNAFIEDNCLCLADLETVIKIPMNEITKVVKLKKRKSFINWTKEEQPKNNKYNNYKVVVQNGNIFTVACYQVVINSSFGEYEIIIPEYEYDSIKKLINLEFIEE